MRLVHSLVLWLAGASALVLGARGWLQLRQEHDELITASQNHLVLLATAIRSGVESAVRDGQTLDVQSMLEQLELKDPAVDIFVFGQSGSLLANSRGSQPNLQRAATLAGDSAETLRVHEVADVGIVAVADVRGRRSRVGRLVVIRPLDALHTDLRGETRAAVISLALLIGTLSLLSWFVLRERLDRPMRRLILGIRRLANGDLSNRFNMAGRNEVAQIAREFDLMAGALEEARSHLQSEAERRAHLDFDMQRANKLATVGELAATLAHEIGSPLQVLNGRARALSLRADLPGEAKAGATILVEQTDRIDRIVQRLLGVVRRKAPAAQSLDLREPVRLVTDLLASEARRRDLRLELSLSEVPKLHADSDNVQQVMLNLLQNAFRASPRGGTVRVCLGPSSFFPPGRNDVRTSVRLDVEDDGIGVPADRRERIFEPFFTAWNDDGRPTGTGLGLSVVRSIVTEHGGTVTVSASRIGRGTCFSLHFPVDVDETGAREGKS